MCLKASIIALDKFMYRTPNIKHAVHKCAGTYIPFITSLCQKLLILLHFLNENQASAEFDKMKEDLIELIG